MLLILTIKFIIVIKRKIDQQIIDKQGPQNQRKETKCLIILCKRYKDVQIKFLYSFTNIF